MSAPVLRAGAAEADITPAPDIQLAGDIGRRRPVEEVRERLYAKALALESAGRRCCVLSLELAVVAEPWVAEIRRRAAERLGLAPEAVLVHALQIHSAPSLGHFMLSDAYRGIPDALWWLRGGDDRYNEPAADAILHAMESAFAALEPATVHVGREIDGRVAFNRRFVLRDGTARGHPKPHERKQILHCEGPIDPEVGVLVLRAEDGRNLAALLHHTCHPVHGYPHRYTLADWPGAWAAGMRAALGRDCVCMVLNGCCGNIHHHNHLDPRHVSNHLRMGSLLTESACAALRELERQPAALGGRNVRLRLELRPLTDEAIRSARDLLARCPEPPWRDPEKTAIEWDWVYAHATMDLAERQAADRFTDYEVQVLRLADTALVALPGEPFVEGQLELKRRSPAPYTFLAHMANGSAGYVPTREALARGGYETRTANWSRLAPAALERIVDAADGLLRELFARNADA